MSFINCYYCLRCHAIFYNRTLIERHAKTLQCHNAQHAKVRMVPDHPLRREEDSTAPPPLPSKKPGPKAYDPPIQGLLPAFGDAPYEKRVDFLLGTEGLIDKVLKGRGMTVEKRVGRLMSVLWGVNAPKEMRSIFYDKKRIWVVETETHGGEEWGDTFATPYRVKSCLLNAADQLTHVEINEKITMLEVGIPMVNDIKTLLSISIPQRRPDLVPYADQCLHYLQKKVLDVSLEDFLEKSEKYVATRPRLFSQFKSHLDDMKLIKDEILKVIFHALTKKPLYEDISRYMYEMKQPA